MKKEYIFYTIIALSVIAGIILVFPKQEKRLSENFTIDWVNQGAKRGIFKQSGNGGKELLAEVPISKHSEALGLEIVGHYGSKLIIRNIGEVDCAFENDYDLWLFDPATKQFTDLQNGLSYLGKFSPDSRYYVFGELYALNNRAGFLPRQESRVLKTLDVETNIVRTSTVLESDQTFVSDVTADPYCEKPDMDIIWSDSRNFKAILYPSETGIVKCAEDNCTESVKRTTPIFEVEISL